MNDPTWTNLGSFIVGLCGFLVVIGSIIIGGIFKIVIALTVLQGESVQRDKEVQELKNSFETRIGRMEDVVFPAMTAAITQNTVQSKQTERRRGQEGKTHA